MFSFTATMVSDLSFASGSTLFFSKKRKIDSFIFARDQGRDQVTLGQADHAPRS